MKTPTHRMPLLTLAFGLLLFAADAASAADTYLVVDLSGGTNAASYPVSYLSDMPAGGWTDEYKTTKLVLRKIPAGTFTMGSPADELGRSADETQHAVTLTKDFYIGVFEVTQRQWELVMGNKPSYFTNATYYATRPVEQVSYYEIRENPANSAISPNWPATNAVHAASFMGKLRAKTGFAAFDLPTESQWEYACRAGTTTALNSGSNLTSTTSCPNLAALARYWYNQGSAYSQSGDASVGTAKVGSYLPNAWGLYDAYGNAGEWSLDWYAASYPGTAIDPKGASSGTSRNFRGGFWADSAEWCRSARRKYDDCRPFIRNHAIGFRSAMTLTASVLDTDADGLPDAWEIEHFGNLTASDGTGDFDRDGRTDAQELADNTDPADAGSTLGLVAYYPFDGNVNDATTNGRNATVGGGAALTLDRFGGTNRACSFDGIDDYVQTPTLINLGQAEYTIAVWFNTANTNRIYQNILNSIPHYGIAIGYGNFTVTNGLVVYVGNGTSWVSNGVGQKRDYRPDTWYLLCFRKQGDEFTVNVNGMSDQVLSAPSSSWNLDTPLLFGKSSYAFDWFGKSWWQGRMDDVRVYNRALSSNEVARLYTATSQPATHLVTLHPGDHGSIANANSGADYVVTVTNGADFPPVTVSAAAGWRFTGWTPAAPATVTNDFTATAGYEAVVTDTDLDGLPDAWEIEHFGNLTASDGTGDFDRDGRTDAQELADNTDPADAGSTLGLVAYYPFDGNANDASGNGKHGTVEGASLAPDRYGIANRAYSFDGLNDYIQASISSDTFGSDYTLYAWVSFRDFANDFPMIAYGENNYVTCHGLGPHYTADQRSRIGFYQDDASHVSGSRVVVSLSTEKLAQSEFYALTISKNSTVARIYLNGVLQQETAVRNTPVAPGNLLFFGGTSGWPQYALNGLIDDIRIYNRALSSNEVARLYAGDSIEPPLPGALPDLSLSSADLRILNAAGSETFNPAVGETVNIEVTVRNTGATNTVGDIFVQVFLDGSPTNLTSYSTNAYSVVASAVLAESLGVGGSRTLLLPWTVTGPDRVVTLTAVAEFASNRAQSQANAEGASSALPATEATLANNATGRSLQLGSPAAGEFGIKVEASMPTNLMSGVSYTLAGTARYDWGVREPVLGARVTVAVNGKTYEDRTVSPDGAWSVLLNGLPSGVHEAHVEADDGRLTGSTNLTLVVGVGVPTRDLRILDLGFEIGTYRVEGETAYAVTGSGVVLRARVRNDGNAASGSFTVAFRDGADTTYATCATNLPAFSEAWVTAPAGWTALAGLRTLSALADSGGAVAETDEGNNARSCTVVGTAALPDLIVTGLGFAPGSPKAGDTVTITATVKNQGAAAVPAGAALVTAFSHGAPVATTFGTGLVPGASVAVSTVWTAAAGTYAVRALADSGGAVAETLEDNNALTQTLSVRQALPDLRPWTLRWGWQQVSGLSFSPAQPVAGEAVTVTCDIDNSGTVPLGTGEAFDVVFSAGGSVFATNRVTLAAPLAVGASVRAEAIWRGGAAGLTNFAAAVDTAGEIAEESEANNGTSAGLAVYPSGASLQAAGLSFSPLQPLPGTAVTLTATVRNDGGAVGGAGAAVAFYAGATNVANRIGLTNLTADVAAKGGTATASLNWLAPGTAGDVAIYVTINGTVFQRTLTVTANPAPNLQVFSEDISVTPALPHSGEAVTVSATVRNTEGSPATNFTVRFSVDSPAGPWVDLGAPVRVTALAVGSNATVTAGATLLASRSAYGVKVEILPNEGQGDADRGDNAATTSFLLAGTPAANAGSDAEAFVGQTVHFNGAASVHASNYVWEVKSAPGNSTAGLVASHTAAPSLTPDQAGTYELRLIVDNGTLSSQPDTVKLTVKWIEWTVTSEHGTPVPMTGTNRVWYGTVLTNRVEAAIAQGTAQYVCTGWNNGPPEGGTTNWFTSTVTSDGRVAWNWRTNYWLGVELAGSGTVSVAAQTPWVGSAPGGVFEPAGSNVVLTAIAAEGWRFDQWRVDGVATNEATNTLTVAMNGPRTATAVFVELTLAEAVDNHSLNWTTGGSSNWFAQVNETSDGRDAARSGGAGNEQKSWLETTVSGPGLLGYRWKVSSEAEYDWLRLKVDNEVWRSIAGEVEWRVVSMRIEGSGTHTLRWEYAKDKTVSEGADCGWLDHVVWTPDYTGFALWANSHGLSGDVAGLFGLDRNGDGVPNGFEYAFGTNLPPGVLLLDIRMVNGRPVVEMPVQDASTTPYVNVRVLGSTNLTDWTLPVEPAVDTAGKPANRTWHEPLGVPPHRAFFKLEAELK